jgi:pyridoxal/pyridoxine/pyridoxamine kinase
MGQFYKAFLDWRSDAGMDNEIADHLPTYFNAAGFHSIESVEASEVYRAGEEGFADKVGIWSKVAETRGLQMVQSGYIDDEDRIRAIGEYNLWIREEAKSMIMMLKEVRGRV